MSFRDITGHRSVLALLSRAVARATLPPSLIFAGPEGVGKRLAAVALAQALNCPAPAQYGTAEGGSAPGVDACGMCVSCRRIARGVNADVVVIEPDDTGSIKIDRVRDVVERTAYRPFEGRHRVVIIDGADNLVVQAQNALLKTLEEPPGTSSFVLVTSQPDTLLPTVTSRCQRLRFGRLTTAEVAGILVRNKPGCARDEAYAAAAAADGSAGRAIEEQSGRLANARKLAERVLYGIASDANPKSRLENARALAPKRGESGSTAGAEREELTLRLRALASLLRDLGVLSTRSDDRLLANADRKQNLLDLAKTYSPSRVARAFLAVDRALGAAEQNASPKVVADWLVFQL